MNRWWNPDLTLNITTYCYISKTNISYELGKSSFSFKYKDFNNQNVPFTFLPCYDHILHFPSWLGCAYCHGFLLHTLRSVTMSGHVKCKRNSLACKMQEDSACNTGDPACKLHSWAQKGTCPVLILATLRHTTESAIILHYYSLAGNHILFSDIEKNVCYK